MKMRVHNEAEANALIKEAQERGDVHELHESNWYTHGGQFLFRLVVWPDGSTMKYVDAGLSASSV